MPTAVGLKKLTFRALTLSEQKRSEAYLDELAVDFVRPLLLDLIIVKIFLCRIFFCSYKMYLSLMLRLKGRFSAANAVSWQGLHEVVCFCLHSDGAGICNLFRLPAITCPLLRERHRGIFHVHQLMPAEGRHDPRDGTLCDATSWLRNLNRTVFVVESEFEPTRDGSNASAPPLHCPVG